MAFYDTWWWTSVHAACSVANLCWLVATITRRQAVRGTHRRYVLATMERATMYPAFLAVAMWVVEDAAKGSTLAFVMDSLALLWIASRIRRLHRDNDDDWFTKTGKRLRRWVTGRLQALRPVPALGAAA